MCLLLEAKKWINPIQSPTKFDQSELWVTNVDETFKCQEILKTKSFFYQ